MAGADAGVAVDIPIDVHTAMSSREYRPLPLTPPVRFTGDRIHGFVQQASTRDDTGSLAAEFLLVRGNLTGAHLKLFDESAARIILDYVPAWLYAVPEMPLLRREGEVFIFVWPHQQPITHRLPKLWLPPFSAVTLTWYNLPAQPDPGLEAVILCRPLTTQEINAR